MAKKKKLAGFRDARQKRYGAAGKKRGEAKARTKATGALPVARSEAVSLKLGPGGRFVIPKKLRKAMGVQVGDTMTAEVVDGELRVRSWETAIRKVQAMFAPYKRPGVDEVEEFLKDRRKMWGE